MKPTLHRTLAGAAAVLVTVLAGTSLWRSFRSSDAAQDAIHQTLGERLAEEVAAAVGSTGALVVVTLDRGASRELDLQRDAFRRHLRHWPGLSLARTDEVDGEPGGKYGPGTGLSARRFQRLREKEPHARAIVSFIGAPDPEDLPPAPATQSGPRLVAISRSPRKLAPLLQQGWLARAIVPRFTFPAPGPDAPSTPLETFHHRFQVVTEHSAP